jgi:hypothetical protein
MPASTGLKRLAGIIPESTAQESDGAGRSKLAQLATPGGGLGAGCAALGAIADAGTYQSSGKPSPCGLGGTCQSSGKPSSWALDGTCQSSGKPSSSTGSDAAGACPVSLGADLAAATVDDAGTQSSG